MAQNPSSRRTRVSSGILERSSAGSNVVSSGILVFHDSSASQRPIPPQRPLIPSLGLPITIPCAPAIEPTNSQRHQSPPPPTPPNVMVFNGSNLPAKRMNFFPSVVPRHSPSPPLTPHHPHPPSSTSAPLLEMGFTLPHIQKAIATLGK